jgi:hypothetical protein
MVRIRKDNTEEVTDSYKTTRDENRGVVVETNEGYFEYWFPVKNALEYIDEKEILAMDSDMKIVEENNTDEETQYDGSSSLTIPKSVAERAENLSGLKIPE